MFKKWVFLNSPSSGGAELCEREHLRTHGGRPRRVRSSTGATVQEASAPTLLMVRLTSVRCVSRNATAVGSPSTRTTTLSASAVSCTTPCASSVSRKGRTAPRPLAFVCLATASPRPSALLRDAAPRVGAPQPCVASPGATRPRPAGALSGCPPGRLAARSFTDTGARVAHCVRWLCTRWPCGWTVWLLAWRGSRQHEHSEAGYEQRRVQGR